MKHSNKIYNKITHTFSNGSYYVAINLQQGKTSYSFLKVVGKLNYVNMKKLNTPFISPGKEFQSFDELQEKTKLSVLKSMALIAEVSLDKYIKNNCDVTSL